MARVSWGRGALVLGLGFPGVFAHAQEPSEAPVEATVPIGSVEEPPTTYEGWGFLDRSPRPGRRFSDVAVHPNDPALILAITQAGTAWLSADSGSTWFQVLEADATRLGDESPDEQVREQVEVEVEDAVAAQGLGEVDEVIAEEGVDENTAVEVIADAAESAAEEAATEVQAEVDANPGFLVGQMGEEGQQVNAELAHDPYRPHGWVTADDRLYVARGDGLLLSTDLGATWDEVLDEPVSAFAVLGDAYVAGGRHGFWRSSDGMAWVPIADRVDSLEVLDLVVSNGRAWAATSDGVRRSADGRQWEQVGTARTKARTIAVDPAGTLWAAMDRTVLTSRDDGVTWVDPIGAPLPGIVDLLAVGTDHVLAAGPGGAHESFDGGATWNARKGGLLDVDTWALALIGGRVWLASDDGLARLEPPEVLALRAAALGAPPPFVPFDALLGSSLDREGLGKTLPNGARFGASAMPRFHLEGRLVTAPGLTYLDSTGTRRLEDTAVTVLGWLEWKPAGRSTGTVDVLVSDGDVLIDNGGDQTLLAARIDRRAMDYRRKLATTVTELYYKRAVLVAERASKRGEPLVVRVNQEIAIQEVEARLDAITDGAVSAWRATGPEEE